MKWPSIFVETEQGLGADEEPRLCVTISDARHRAGIGERARHLEEVADGELEHYGFS